MSYKIKPWDELSWMRAVKKPTFRWRWTLPTRVRVKWKSNFRSHFRLEFEQLRSIGRRGGVGGGESRSTSIEMLSAIISFFPPFLMVLWRPWNTETDRNLCYWFIKIEGRFYLFLFLRHTPQSNHGYNYTWRLVNWPSRCRVIRIFGYVIWILFYAFRVFTCIYMKIRY